MFKNWLLKNLEKYKPPVSDFHTVGSAFLQKLKPPVKDIRTIGRAGSSLLDKLKTSPMPSVKKRLDFIPKVGEAVGKVATGFVFGDVKEKGITGIPEHIWEVEKHIGKIPFKFGMSTLLASTKPGKVEKKPLKIPVLGEVSTYQKDAQDIFSKVIDGELPLAYGMLPILETVWDASIASSLFRQGAKSAIKKIKVPDQTHIGAWEFLGKKPTIGATRKEVAKLQKTFHPDKPFGSVEKSAAINDAYSILKKQGIPKVKPFQAGVKRGLEMFEKPVSELMRTPSGRAYAGVKGFLPQRAGYMPVQPYQPRRPAFGLSIRETGEKPISNKIISALGKAKRTDPLCVKTVRTAIKENPNAIPERVIFSDTIENASKQYLSNIKKGIHKQLEGFTHIRANVNGKIIESKAAIKGAKPFTEESIKKFVSKEPTPVEIDAVYKAEIEKEAAIIKREVEGDLFSSIKELGGIKSFKGGFLTEEISGVPLNLRNNKTGSTMDELATELSDKGYNFDSGDELRKAILAIRTEARPAAKPEVVKTLRIIKKTVPEKTELLNRIAKLEKELTGIKTEKDILASRRYKIKAVKEHFGLTDNELKKISRKDIRLMTNFEFKNFIDDVRIKADKLGKKRQAMNELLQQIKDKEVDVENMRKAIKLPTMKNMAITDIKKLDEALKPFQKGDEFLSVRKLEVVDRTELKGIKTWREARERLAKKLNVPVEKLQNIKVSEFDRYEYDTALAEKNPFYRMMVEKTSEKMLISEAEYLKLEKDVFDLAKKLKPKGILGRIIPQQKNIRAFMEATPEKRAGIELTETETKLVKLMTKEFEDVRSYLIQMEAMKMGKENYFTHIRRGILEAVREDGIIKATKEVFIQYKLEEQAFNILDTQTGEILAMDKFFKFAMHRTGEIKPTENTVKAFLTYMKTFKKKQALDEIVPLVDIYAHALTPKGLTKKGLLLHGNLQRFVKEWLNTKKGRHITLAAKQNGKIDGALRSIKMFTSLRDLGLNIPVSVASEVGEQVTTYQLLGKWKFGLGKVRQLTKQGKTIIEKYRNLIGKNPWRELGEPSKEAGDRLMEGIFILFRDASTRANKTFLLGSLSKQEFKTGIITPERLSALRTELGRYRMVQGMKSIIGATPEGAGFTQYKTWAIPILRTNIKNLEILGKKITRQSKGSNEWKKSILELYREAEITAFAMLAFSLARDEDDDSFVGQIINKMYRESTTLIQALQPRMFLTAGRTASFVTELGENLTSILLWEKYKTKEGLKGVEGLKRQLTPVFIKQITKATEEPKTPYEKAVAEDKEKDKEARERIKPIYDKIQELKKTDYEKAKELANSLSKEDREVYKKIKTADKTKETKRMKEELYPKFLKIQELKKTDYEEARRLAETLTEEERRIYKLLKAQLD